MKIEAINSNQALANSLVAQQSATQSSANAKTATDSSTIAATALINGALADMGTMLVTPTSGSDNSQLGAKSSNNWGFEYQAVMSNCEALDSELDEQGIALDKQAQRAWIANFQERMSKDSYQDMITAIDNFNSHNTGSYGSAMADAVNEFSGTASKLQQEENDYQKSLHHHTHTLFGLKVPSCVAKPIEHTAHKFITDPIEHTTKALHITKTDTYIPHLLVDVVDIHGHTVTDRQVEKQVSSAAIKDAQDQVNSLDATSKQQIEGFATALAADTSCMNTLDGLEAQQW